MKPRLVVPLLVLVALAACAAYLLWPPPEEVPPPPAVVDTSGDAATGQTDEESEKPDTRPAKWAQPIDLPGCPNLHKVSDDLYRGAQPTAEGMEQLRQLGVRTIINLRSLHSDRDEIGDLDLSYHHINMKAWHGEDEDVVKFLNIMKEEENLPAFVHCQHGADRTGTMSAIYRIVFQGWSRKEALQEMVHGGFNFHSIWQNLLRYLQKMDIDELKREAGMTAAEEGA